MSIGEKQQVSLASPESSSSSSSYEDYGDSTLLERKQMYRQISSLLSQAYSSPELWRRREYLRTINNMARKEKWNAMAQSLGAFIQPSQVDDGLPVKVTYSKRLNQWLKDPNAVGKGNTFNLSEGISRELRQYLTVPTATLTPQARL